MADYSITAVDRRVVYSGSAGTGPYAFTFPVLATTDIAVFKDSTKLTEGSGSTQYTVALNASNGTGSVTLGAAATSSNTITITGARTIERTTDFVTAGDLLASSLNTELDSQTIFVQQVAEDADRAIKAPVTDPTSIDMTLPAKADRLGKLLGFDSSTGNPEATTGRVNSVSVSTSTVGVGGSATGSATFTDSTGALAFSLGIPTGATGSTGSTGAAGSEGTDGVGGLLYTFSTTTSDADPGAGVIRLNNGTLGSVSQIFIDDSTAASGNPDVSAFILTWDDSTQTSDRGQVTITKKSAQQNFATYKISGASTDASGYVKLAVTHVVSNGSFSNSDAVLVSFTRTGNAGSLADPMTTRGDVIIRDSSNATARLAVGSANTVLTSDGTDPSYAQVATAMIADDAVSLAKMASGTDGNLITYDASGNPAHVATGSSGQVLTSNGAGAAPTFQAAGGGLNHLTTATASSSASLDFTSLITSTYDVYLIMLDEIMPATNAADLYLLLSGDNGSSFSSSNYAYVTDTLTKHNHGDSVSRSSTSARGLAQIQLMNSAATNQGAGISGPIYLFSPLNTSLQPSLRWSFIGNDNGVNLKVLDGAAKEETSSARDAFQIKFSSGNIASGHVRVYGIANG